MPRSKYLQKSGVGEIRTHEGLSPLAVFKTAAFNHSATTPGGPNFLARRGLRKAAHLVVHPPARAIGEEYGEGRRAGGCLTLQEDTVTTSQETDGTYDR
jgi:hypothetical protein